LYQPDDGLQEEWKMHKKLKIVFAMLVGMAIGVGGTVAIHAQQAKAAGYIIAEVDVKDAPTFQKYAAQVPPTMAPFGGHDLVRGGKAEALEGEAPKRMVVIKFESVEKARAWYNSPAYDAIKGLRINSTQSRLILVEGVPGE
jgi:uncharacterized protein (DUF1330 family)